MAPATRLVLFLSLSLSGLACQFAADLADRASRELQGGGPGGGAGLETAPPDPVGPRPLPPEQDPPPSPAADGAAALTPEIQQQMDQIQEQVVQLRGLQPTGPVARSLLSAPELRRYVTDEFLADYTEPEAKDDVRALALLGLIDPGYDLFALYLELYSEQIAGFYDDELKQLFVVQGAEFRGPERMTYAHEYTHALQDQHYDLRNGLGFNDEACELDRERCLAVQALVEGDASLLEERWLLTFATEQDYQDLRDFYATLESPVFDSAPRFLQEDFLFPYLGGRDFVEYFFRQGGWASVEAVYADPPRSTEQILHPERYPGDRPVRLQPAELVAVLGSGWREIDRDVLGEWYTQLMLREQLSEEQSASAAEGWGGDYFLAFHHDEHDRGAMVLVTAWDTLGEAHEFFGLFLQYGDARFGLRSSSATTLATWVTGLVHVSIELAGDQTLWILAPDTQLAGELRRGVPFPASISP